VIKTGPIDVALGVNLKYLRNDYNLDIRTVGDPVFSNGNVGSAFTADMGVLALWPNTGVSFAFVGKNITQPDIGLKTLDPVSGETVIGIACYQEKMPYVRLPQFTAAFDMVTRAGVTDYRLGVETWLRDGAFAVRSGVGAQAVTFGLGYEIPVFSGSKLIIDYAFAWPLEIEKTTGSHRLGLSLRLP
jgi:hypothetical protein